MKKHITKTRDTNSTECVQHKLVLRHYVIQLHPWGKPVHNRQTSANAQNICDMPARINIHAYNIQLAYAMPDGDQPVMPSTHFQVTKRQHDRGNRHHISQGYA